MLDAKDIDDHRGDPFWKSRKLSFSGRCDAECPRVVGHSPKYFDRNSSAETTRPARTSSRAS